MKNMRLVCTVILILPLLALTTSADDRDYDEVLVLMKTVEKKILDFENSRKTDVTARINRIEQDVESIRSDTNANNIVINDFTTEIRSLMAGLKQSIDENNQPNATDKTNNPDKAEDIDSGDIRVYWKNGINMETRDKKVTFRIGARIMNDWTFFSPETKLADTLGDFNGGTEIRRAWIQASGLVGGNI